MELIDRFGLLPGPAKLLLRIASLKRMAAPLGINRIEAGPKGIRIEFDASSKVDPGRLITLMQSRPGYRLDGRHLRLKIELPSADARIESLRTVLSALGAPAPV